MGVASLLPVPREVPDPLYTSPFLVGDSPFQIKGVAFRGYRRHYVKTVPGGYAAISDAIADPELRKFFDQQFLDGSMYDLFAMPLIDQVAGRLCGRSFSDYVHEGAAMQAESDLGGI